MGKHGDKDKRLEPSAFLIASILSNAHFLMVMVLFFSVSFDFTTPLFAVYSQPSV